MSFELYINGNDFVITNDKAIIFENLSRIEEESFNIFGYCFTDDDIVKNSALNSSQFNYIKKNQSKISGIFSALSYSEGKIEIVLDPLVQYNLFYYVTNEKLTISNSLTIIANAYNLKDTDERHLLDSIAYKSPLRGLTMLKGVYTVQYDDILNNLNVDSYKPKLPLISDNLTFLIPRDNIYSEFSYSELLYLYISRLNKRSKILSDKYDEVHIQLTGGADSRLVLSSFKDFKNICCYVYGDGQSQNRLFYEHICNGLNVRKCNEIVFAGKTINNSSLIIRGLYDSNFRKFNNLNTYMNSDEFVFSNKCKVTGYYGANVCGGIGFPPHKTQDHIRTKSIPSEFFTYHDYVDIVKSKYNDLRISALKDIFYLNNRGPSHYAAHSIADNLKCNSFDILYDVINLELVKKCPYNNSDIDGNAISIDLIYLNHPLLALFPYDDRKIPRYREFNNIPLINCFDGLKFGTMDIPRIKSIRPTVNTEKFNLLKKGDEPSSMSEMLNYDEFDDFFNDNPHLVFLRNEDSISSGIVLYYLLSTVFFDSLNKDEVSPC